MKGHSVCLSLAISLLILDRACGIGLLGASFGALDDIQFREKRDVSVTCNGTLSECFSNFDEEYGGSGPERANALRTSGAIQACSDSLGAIRCALELVENCPDFNDTAYAESFNVGLMIAEYQCVTRISDTVKHWNCLTNVDVYKGFHFCSRPQDGACNFKSRVECIVDIAANTAEDCGTGSLDYLSDFIEETENLMNPNCQSIYND